MRSSVVYQATGPGKTRNGHAVATLAQGFVKRPAMN
jgi:hypothetical protein